MKILIASKNPHKISKITQILQNLQKENQNNSKNSTQKYNQNLQNLKIESLLTFEAHEIEENGETFADNAELKAKNLSQNYDGLVIATDGGAIIPALPDWNALHTKRFLGANKTDNERAEGILELMKNKTDRRIWFVEVFVVFGNSQKLLEVETVSPVGILADKWDGRIKFGAYLLALWYLPNLGKMFFDLTAEEVEKEENTWRILENSLRKFWEL